MPWHEEGNIHRGTMTGAAEIHGIDRRQPCRIQHGARSDLVRCGFLRCDVLKTGTVTSFAGDTEHGVVRIEVASDGGGGGMAAKTASHDLAVDGIAESLRNIAWGRC